jgi:Fe-S-cluster containining protein
MKKTAKRGKGVGVFARLGNLYERMSSAYGETAAKAGLSCEGCQQNCCYSYFQHHTYIEWSYLWRGMNELPQERRDSYLQRAHEAVRQYQHSLSMGLPPSVMCPLNDDGLCGVYKHRLMICRMHGTRNTMLLPNGDRRVFTGCYRFVDNVKDMPDELVPALDRTELYKELVQLEMEFVGAKLRVLPRVNMTLAEMLVQGPPIIK